MIILRKSLYFLLVLLLAFSSYLLIAKPKIGNAYFCHSLDIGFTPGYGTGSYIINGLGLQSDNKIIIGGYFSDYDGDYAGNIARLNTDGTLDETFLSGDGFDSGVDYLIIQPDDKIITSGLYYQSYDNEPVSPITRLNDDGTLDNTFSADPFVIADAMAYYPTGSKIIITGNFSEYDSETRNNIARLNADGSLDETFDPGAGLDSPANKIISLSDDKILIFGGFSSYDGNPVNGVARLNADGSFDGAFDAGAIDGTINTAILDAGGNIIIAGPFTEVQGEPRSGIARLDPDGTLDATFDPGIGFEYGDVSDIVIQSSGDIVVIGSFQAYDGEFTQSIVRIEADGSLDEAFIPIPDSSYGGTQRMLVQPDDEIIIVNESTSVFASDIFRIGEDENCFYSLTYSIGFGSSHMGSLSGDTQQYVLAGEDGTPVEAIPNPGYQFVQWSDASTDNPRIDLNPSSDIFIQAQFSQIAPFEISTCGELQDMDNDLYAEYILTQDIDCSDTVNWNHNGEFYEGFSPIGGNSGFGGILNGNGYKIRDLYINRPDSYHVGLFGVGGSIYYLGLEDVDITGGYYVGGFSGGNSDIRNSYIAGGSVTGLDNSLGVGGISGADTYFFNSYSDVDVVAGENSGYVGGAVGDDRFECYLVCAVIIPAPTGYSIGLVSAGAGVLGVGGFSGYEPDEWIRSNAEAFVWDIETSGQLTSEGPEQGKTTAEMKDIQTYLDLGWDIIPSETDLNNGYPYLDWMLDRSNLSSDELMSQWVIYSPTPPTIENEEATSIDQNFATLNAEVVYIGTSDVLSAGFEYGLTDSYGETIGYTVIDGSEPFTFDVLLEDLSCGTEYFFRAYAENNAGLGYGEGTIFETLDCDEDPPVVEDNPATSVGQYLATLNAEVTDIGTSPVTSAGFEYGLTDSYGTTANYTVTDGSAPFSFEVLIENLACETEYFFRSFATNDVGTSYGDGDSFETLECDDIPPVVDNESVTLIEQDSATLNADVLDVGDFPVTSAGFEYGLTGAYGSTVNATVDNEENPFSFSAPLSGLSCGTEYFFIAFAESDAGLSYGDGSSFTTLDCDDVPDPEPEPPASSSRSFVSGTRFCTDEITTFCAQRPVQQPDPSSVGCDAKIIINDHMKEGNRDGRYSEYNQGVVTEVNVLQSHINNLLVDEYGVMASGPVDGIFGPLTKRGVMRLQARLNQIFPNPIALIIDGIVGPLTKKAINNCY
jgi:uncharacterized delta-60 repeat protein